MRCRKCGRDDVTLDDAGIQFRDGSVWCLHCYRAAIDDTSELRGAYRRQVQSVVNGAPEMIPEAPRSESRFMD